MKPLRTTLETTIRPRLLVVAARHAMTDYHRDRMLPKLLGLPLASALPPLQDVLERLTLSEAMMEQARRHHDAGWRPSEHVLVMAALMSETLYLQGSQARPHHALHEAHDMPPQAACR
ncbi:DUF6477 family protein [Roseinatronobacter alkalisoli]|uniref:DUF6477 family protein n=1 Tax=Roseinatronobacter alkalisoli TaxID=3028235 RepID=A0ABT5T7C2_9RHOB|nr:DUF6477 family protein [Roseinatronobacter sp. HJB301]MDD7970866.1 DUF6477 family protein [Roseinatronobacter sp. HJB301]